MSSRGNPGSPGRDPGNPGNPGNPGKRTRHPLASAGVQRRALKEGRPELEQFRNRLAWAMAEKNMSASDLARALWGEVTDARGYTVAKGRDRMTHYLAGAIYPSPDLIERIAKILEIDPNSLARDEALVSKPIPASGHITRQTNKLDMSINIVSPVGGKSLVMVTIHCPVSLETATKIARLIEDEKEKERH